MIEIYTRENSYTIKADNIEYSDLYDLYVLRRGDVVVAEFNRSEIVGWVKV